MATSKLWNAPDLVPSITYSDLPRAIEWLERVFGFRERAEARLTWPGGGMAWFEIGGGLLHIVTPDETWNYDSGAAARGVVMKVYVDDVDEHFSRAKAAGAKILSEPEDGFWGGRIYRALDHEGRQWEISQSGRDLASDQWQLPPGVTRGVTE
ncbi:MAG TPA: VOC family protein [Pyrinomonadaceae bacterium]|nr:VOC family protein [Pyrinomonadaceae bacterium]